MYPCSGRGVVVSQRRSQLPTSHLCRPHNNFASHAKQLDQIFASDVVLLLSGNILKDAANTNIVLPSPPPSQPSSHIDIFRTDVLGLKFHCGESSSHKRSAPVTYRYGHTMTSWEFPSGFCHLSFSAPFVGEYQTVASIPH